MMRFGLAPMEGVGDFPTRLWFAILSQPAFCGTPFFRVTRTHPANGVVEEFVWPELGFAKNLVPYELVPQVMAAEPEHFVRIAENIFCQHEKLVLEINCGCPSPRVVGHGAGSSILIDPLAFGKKIAFITERIGASRLSVKMRLGFHHADEFNELFSEIKDLPLARVVVHGRTRAQSYKGKADWHKIHWASTEGKNTVWGSGDICSVACVQQMQNIAPAVKTMIIGRGALRNPWIFAQLRTGAPTTFSQQTIRYALSTFALLQFSYTRENFSRLRRCLEPGIFLQPADSEEFSWQEIYQRICENVLGAYHPPSMLTLGSKVLGRVKMLWHYMRSSLHNTAMDPMVLRSRDFYEFFSRLDLLLAPQTHLRYCPDLDWLYSGERQPQAESKEVSL